MVAGMSSLRLRRNPHRTRRNVLEVPAELNKPVSGLHTCTTSPLLDEEISCYTNSDCSSIPCTPKRGRPRTRPLFSSTPTSDFQPLSPKRAKNSWTQHSHQNAKGSSRLKTPPTDVTSSTPQRLTGAGRTRGRKKKNVEEQLITSPTIKQWKSATSDLEAPQEEPDETPPANEAHFDTQMPEHSTNVTTSRPQRLAAAGKTRGRKKKKVEEHPIASLSVKQCRKSAKSNLEIPQKEPAVENLSANEAHVETRMPDAPTDTSSRPQRLTAAGRPRGRKKKKVEEQPIASLSVKQCRKSAKSNLEISPIEPAVENLSANEAHVETRMPDAPTDIPSRPQRLTAAGRPRGSKKKKVEEQPIASPSVKQCRKSSTSDLEGPQEEPAVETSSANEAHVETQIPSRPQRLTAAGRPRGRKKKKVEEQPIASLSVKQCRKSAKSNLEISPIEPAVETSSENEAHVETQIPSRTQRLTAAGRPRGRKKKKVEEQPIASPSVKQCSKSATSDLEGPQKQPAVETSSENEAHVETQIPSRTQRLTAAGRPRGRKKKKVEEQPIASPSVKQCSKSATSDLEGPQKQPAVETSSENEAHVETQIPSRTQRLTAAGRPRGRKKKKVEEQPIASPSVKQCSKSATSDLEGPQKQPAVETSSENEAHVETQIPSRTQRLTAAGRPRGRKKKKVEEQPIASPSVKQCSKSATSDLEGPQKQPAVETPPPNEAHVETQMPEPSTDVTPSKFQRLTATGRTRGRKKKKVEEQPNSSPVLKRCRKSAKSVSQEELVEKSPELDQNMSSDLSIELSLQENPLNNSCFMEEEEDLDDDDDEELPSFLQQDNKKPLSISKGLCVWCKLRKYPYWPAVVKSVNRKNKKASIVFIDCYLIDQKRIRKGFSVSLRTLKPFDCEECEHLVDIAKEKYGSAITWSLELISDYRIRIGCGSFTGSFIEYCAADISCPLRRKYSEGKSLLTFPSQEILGEHCDSSDNNMEDIVVEEQDELLSKKVLPDRSKAARNRDNKQLVDFIIRRKVEKRLLAVISGCESSKWMQALQKPSRPVVDVYLEDEEQVDKVYRYLNKVCDSAPQINRCLENIQADRIRLILDVLLPEAIIYAIAGVHKLSLEKAEEKYRKGPCFSNRERQEFDMMIEQQMKLKENTQHHGQ
ncbi:PWWP domain-containing DNA repair factor 3B isoform X2 [Puntigrus tetrazona]|uniref:PWWP domain-containing DNA repair factor 3B isoform X2 n=1 Tax=Puntigrus tetrazona TaxID=1606681 RepID=UPI001C8A9B0D|nr:PWWP domain-containing DNA repair factor 3B isoform X2 [Puntigrus tetrazona]